MCRSKGNSAGRVASRGAVLCSFLTCLAVATTRMSMPHAQLGGASTTSILPQVPRCLAESAFFKGLPQHFRWPEGDDALSLRILKEYGAIFVAREGVTLPPVLIFSHSTSAAQWQSRLRTESAVIAGIRVRLQVAAMRALMRARQEATEAHVVISPRGADGAQRTYEQTVELWMRHVNPGLRQLVAKGALSVAEAERIRKLPPQKQVPEILQLEERGLFFSKIPSKSILSGVAPPGASQHLFMLALDVKEHNNSVVRSILARHGWFQTVKFDLPHFTYLGVEERQLPSLGLKMVKSGGRVFWVPDFECPPASR